MIIKKFLRLCFDTWSWTLYVLLFHELQNDSVLAVLFCSCIGQTYLPPYLLFIVSNTLFNVGSKYVRNNYNDQNTTKYVCNNYNDQNTTQVHKMPPIADIH